MDAYFERIKSNAENIAKNVFPKKALELDDIINVSSLMKWRMLKFDENLMA